MKKIFTLTWAFFITAAIGFQYYTPFDESGTKAITALNMSTGDTVTEAKMDQIDTNDAYLNTQIEGLKDGTVALTTPALGEPASGTATNITGLPIATGVSGLGTGNAAALAVNSGSAGAPVLFNGAGGTPSAIILTYGTALPLTTGVTGTLPLANGGTGQVSASAAADVFAASMTPGVLPSDSVTPSDLDQDGDYTSLTGDWATTGTLTGAIKIDNDSDGYTVTGAMMYGGLLVESGNQQTVTLDPVFAGAAFCVLADGADGSAEIYVDCDAGDHFEYDGTTMANGEYIRNDSDTKGDRMCFVGIDSSTWIVTYGGDTTVAQETP